MAIPSYSQNYKVEYFLNSIEVRKILEGEDLNDLNELLNTVRTFYGWEPRTFSTINLINQKIELIKLKRAANLYLK
jgi:hypothetical protein